MKGLKETNVKPGMMIKASYLGYSGNKGRRMASSRSEWATWGDPVLNEKMRRGRRVGNSSGVECFLAPVKSYF